LGDLGFVVYNEDGFHGGGMSLRSDVLPKGPEAISSFAGRLLLEDSQRHAG
jgi:hypothetical protein